MDGGKRKKKAQYSDGISITVGDELLSFIEGARQYSPRNCISQMNKYIDGPVVDKVCVVYGLRRTGKTTMLKHEMLRLSSEELARTAYIKCKPTDTLASLNKVIQKLEEKGFVYLFLDEVTLVEDFIEGSALFSDVFAACGMKIVLSGTDSLGFYFAQGDELYDRAVMIHTTVIPYGEHSRLLGIKDIDEYIRYGGTLKAGELDFEDEEVNSDEASFRDDETTRRYIDSAICRNIQHSLKCYHDGRYFRHLRDLYEKNELTNAINRIIEDENHRFALDVVTRLFKSHDLASVAQMLRSARDERYRTDILDSIDKTGILDTLKRILSIKEMEKQEIGIEEVHIKEIKEYLKLLDLTDELRIETVSGPSLEYTIFTQPGMRFSQAEALIYSLGKDEAFNELDRVTQRLVFERITEGVLGHMLEDIVLFETKKRLMPRRYGNRREVFKLMFANGEYDMVITDCEDCTCQIFEVKHSSKRIPAQYRHLINEDFAAIAERRYGTITRRCVLYKGDDYAEENGIEYMNVEKYLSSLDKDMRKH